MPIDDPSNSPWLQLWFSRISDATADAEQNVCAQLSQSEHGRLLRIKHDGKRREYLLSRALMRHALGEQFHRAESDWHFTERSGAPPAIAELPSGIYLSLSHSGGYLCFAISNSVIGIDIEVVRQRHNLLAMAKMFMDDTELDQLVRKGASQEDYFYRAWCAKEACYKSLAPAQQAKTSLPAISYRSLLDGHDQRLIEGGSTAFRFAAAMTRLPGQTTQTAYLANVQIPLTGMA
jgi:phosphopantetheine--protein transferase-like protein